MSTIQENLRYAVIADAVYSAVSDRTGAEENIQVIDSGLTIISESIKDPTWADGLQAMCVADGSEIIVAYRGTKGPADLAVDYAIGKVLFDPTGMSGAALRAIVYRHTVEQTYANYAAEIAAASDVKWLAWRLINSLGYYDEMKQKLSFESYKKVCVVGHSLGGYLAIHVGHKNSVPVRTFNTAPGAKYSLVDRSESVDNLNNIHNHRVIGDVISGPMPLWSGVSDESPPYGHLGMITHWKAPDTWRTDAIKLHNMERFLTEIKFNEKHRAAPPTLAPTNAVFY